MSISIAAFKATTPYLLDKLIAVHTTSILPSAGHMIPGNSANKKIKQQFAISELPDLRHTLHWCLGSVITDQFFPEGAEELCGQINSRPFAIVTRLRNLVPQLVNIYAADTFILGNYYLGPGDYIIVPAGTEISEALRDSQVNIINYTPEERLTAKVQELIDKLGGHQIRHVKDKSKAESKAYINELEINNPQFFAALLKEYNISFGLHSHSLINQIGQAFDQLEYFARIIIEMLIETDKNYLPHRNFLSMQIVSLNHCLQLISDYVQQEAARLPKHAIKSFKQMLRREKKWGNLLKLELELNKQQQTLFGRLAAANNRLLRQTIIANLENLSLLKQIVVENPIVTSPLPKKAAESSSLTLYEMVDIAQTASFLPLKSMRPYFKRQPPELIIAYANRRWRNIGKAQALSEGLERLIGQTIQAFNDGQPGNGTNSLKLILSSMWSLEARSDESYKKIFNHLAEVIQRQLDNALPNKNPELHLALMPLLAAPLFKGVYNSYCNNQPRLVAFELEQAASASRKKITTNLN